VKQGSECERFKNATKKCEDELKSSAEANEAQRGEFAQLKDENKGTKERKARPMEEVGKLKEEIRQSAAQQDSLAKELAEAKDRQGTLGVKQFPPSVKEGKIEVEVEEGWQRNKGTVEMEIDVPEKRAQRKISWIR
jgi:chromosome segregation ATPase